MPAPPRNGGHRLAAYRQCSADTGSGSVRGWRRLGTVLAVWTSVACAGSEPLPPVHQPASTPAASGVAVSAVSGNQPACEITSESEGVAAGLVGMLGSADDRTAQFALDSLVLIRGDAMRLLLCELEDDRPTRVRRFYMLNRVPSLAPVSEFVRHHDAATVGEAVGLLVGAPAKGGEVCPGRTRAARAACAAAWRAYLRKAGRER